VIVLLNEKTLEATFPVMVMIAVLLMVVMLMQQQEKQMQ
jgi:preprotein translocase subunit SecG